MIGPATEIVNFQRNDNRDSSYIVQPSRIRVASQIASISEKNINRKLRVHLIELLFVVTYLLMEAVM